MKRLNEKGFATSSILYSLLILFVFLALGVLALFANSKMVFDKMKTDMLASLNGVDKVVITPNAEYVVADFGSKDDILSTYFNFRLIGESPILTKVCIDKSRSDTQVVNVEELSIGQHEIECTIIKENGYSKSATINITIDSDYVCSSVTNTTGGKIAFGDYLLGDEYECNPGDGIGKRFYVINSNYNNVSLIMNKNIGDNIEYDASGGNLLKEAETQLVSKTNNWNSVTVSFPTKDQIMTAILGSSPSTYDEYWFHKPNFEWILTNTNCLNRNCSDEGTTDTTLGYWISGNVSSGKAWTVDYASMFIKENTNRITKGVRPVITVNKTDIYNALEGIDIPSITVTPSSGWSPSKNVTILFPARMYEVDYEYSTNGINWITLDPSERIANVPFTEDGYVIARMMVDDKLIHSVTTNIGNISLGIGENVEYVYNGSTQTFVSPVTGKYKLEVWGASGGGYTSSYETNGGRGGYSVGTVNLNVGTILYIYAGGEGGYTYTNGGFNGGGNSYAYGGSGGGASDIRIGTDSLYSRVIVAGGGGGGGYTTRIGGYGGGTYGGDGDSGTVTPGGGGTATYGGTTGSGGIIGVFGGAQDRSSGAGGGGGGGWYGGGSGMSGGADSGGGGGSGYVYTSSTASQCPSGCLLVPSYYLSNASTYRGNTTFLSPEGNNVVGHTGNGYVRITLISQS